MDENKSIWEWSDSSVMFDENGLPIVENTDEYDEEESRPSILLKQEKKIEEKPQKENLPTEVINLIKNGKKEKMTIDVKVDIEVLPDVIIDFISESYGIEKEKVIMQMMEMSIDKETIRDVIKKIVEEKIQN